MAENNGKQRSRINATTRLYTFLAAVEGTEPNTNTPLIDVAMRALSYPGDPSHERDFAVLNIVAGLLKRSENEIRRNLPGKEFYLRPFDQLYRFFSPRTCAGPWMQARLSLMPKTINDIENTGHSLLEIVPELTLEPEDFTGIREILSTLYEALQAADITKEVRKTLLDLFVELEQAIADYRWAGSMGIQDAYENVMGKIAVDPDIHKELLRDSENKGVLIRRMKNVVLAVIWILSTANTIVEAPKNLAPIMQSLFLHSPANPSDVAPKESGHSPKLLIADFSEPALNDPQTPEAGS